MTTFDAGYALGRMKGAALLPLTIAITNDNRRIASAAAAALVLADIENTGRLVITSADRSRLSTLYNLKVISASYVQHRVRLSPELLLALERNATSNDSELRTASAAALITVSNRVAADRKRVELEDQPLRRRR